MSKSLVDKTKICVIDNIMFGYYLGFLKGLEYEEATNKEIISQFADKFKMTEDDYPIKSLLQKFQRIMTSNDSDIINK